jgi:predicted glycosyltransferase
MKIMLYSQHVLGIGHFFRSMELARALERHDVLFIEGGDPLPGFVPPSHVRRLLLPALMMDPEFKVMQGRDGALSEIKCQRMSRLMESFLAFAPDLFITELFPFGRKQFRFELMPVLETVRERSLPTRVICSLRDILVEKEDQPAYENGVLQVLNGFYHHLLIHSDPRVISLDETFERVAEIGAPIHYTGFVVRKPPVAARRSQYRTILASSGGGKVGVELLASAILAVQQLSTAEVRLRVFIGPFMETTHRDYLAGLARKDSRTTVEPFSLDFLAELARADISVSMAGYNTCMDILSTGIKALVYPFPQNREQSMRARKLESMQVLRILENTEVHTLCSALGRALEEPPIIPRMTPNIAGAANTANWVEKEFGSH